MSHFVYDSTTLFATKSDAYPIGTADPTKRLQASELNAIAAALSDMRDVMRDWKTRTVSGDTTLDASDYAVYISAASKTITLPPGDTGYRYIIKDTSGSGGHTIATSSSQQIDGSSTYSMSAGNQAASLRWDTGAGMWRLVGSSGSNTKTLSAAYTDGTTAADSTITVVNRGSGTGGVIIKGATSDAVLYPLQVQTNGGTVLLGIEGSGATGSIYRSPISDASNAIAHIVDTVNSITASGTRLLEIRRAGSARFQFYASGDIGFRAATSKIGFASAGTAVDSGLTFTTNSVVPQAGTTFGPAADNTNAAANILGAAASRWYQTWSMAFLGNTESVTYSGTPTFNPATGVTKRMICTGNPNISINNGQAGQFMAIVLIASGATRTPTFAGSNHHGFGTPTGIEDTKRSFWYLAWDPTDNKWNVISARENVA